MSEEIICLSSDDEEIICLSSDDEDTCIENSTEAGITSISSTKKNTEYQFSTYDSETWRKRVVAEEEERCIYYEEKVKKQQDEISYLEKYVEKVKLESEESQTNLANFLVNPANSHLEDIISIAIEAEKRGYKSILQEVINSKKRLKMLEKHLAIHKSHLKMFMQTDSEFLESVKHDEKKF